MFNGIEKFLEKKGILSLILIVSVSFGVSFLGNVLPARSAFFTDCTDTVTTTIPQIQCEALEALYESTNGDNWTSNTNWGTNTDINTWEGVEVSGGNVTVIDIVSKNLTGTIPSDLENLTALTRLYLTDNNLTGSIPSELGNINTLLRLYLDENQLTGGIPASLGSLPNLERLYLRSNNLTGEIPITVGTFTSLTRLNLGNNNLIGNIPTDIGGATNLESLYLENNELDGSIPTEIGNLTSLRNVFLNDNQLSGSIPTQIGNLTSLENLFLSSNKLTGSLPIEIGNLVNLIYLNLSSNQLDGLIPIQIGNLVDIEYLYLRVNNFTGSLPAELLNLSKLTYFYANNNHFSGDIPDFTTIPTMSSFSITRNNFVFGDFETEFPTYLTYDQFYYMPQEQVDLDRTISVAVEDILTITPSVPVNTNDEYKWFKDGLEIVGATDRVYTKTTRAEDAGTYTYQIRNSVIGGEINPAYFLYSYEIVVTTDSVCTNGSLTILPIECNALEAIYVSLSETDWTDNTNWRFSSDVNTWYGVTVAGGVVTELDLSNNNLTGTIPSDIENLTSLSVLNLGTNGITGNIPTEIENIAPTLTVLDVSNNKITGTISTEILNLTNLTTLYLYGNNFTGSIPDGINGLTNLVRLGLRSNQFSSMIPITLTGMSTLVEVNLGSNLLSGIIPPEIGNMTNITELSLANNKLTGNIPTELENLATNLIKLDLGGNSLVGEIPIEIANLPNITDLLLNDNKLTGSIPAVLLGLNNLQSVSFGGNYFTGDVPNFSTIGTLNNLDLHDNELIFTDFETEFIAYSSLGSFVHSPQKKVDESRSIRFIENETFKIIPQVTLNPSGNDRYQWYKDGVSMVGATDRIYQAIAEEDDEGVYQYQVTNTTFVDGSSIPTLTLVSEDILVHSGNEMVLVDCKQENITGVPELECEALKNLFTYTDGQNWTINTNWGRSTNIGIWYGLNVEDGHVTEIDLRNNNINGLLPDSITDLIELKTLLLRDNTFYGSLPDSIGILSKLEKLDFAGNQLGGGIPTSIGNLINLKSLFLSNNNLTGAIPTEIGNLVNLEVLNLDRNQLSCNIPAEIQNITKLFYQLGLQVYGNDLIIPVDTNSDFYIFLERVSATGLNHFTIQDTPACDLINLPPTSISLSNLDLNEGLTAGSGSTIGALTASDSDTTAANLIFSLIPGEGDNDNSKFKIVKSGELVELQASVSFDFETKSIYSIRINVSDGDNNYAKSFTIKVNDVRDGEFFDCSSVKYIPVSECDALVDLYNALDGDNSDLNWATQANIKDWNNLEFEITPTPLDKDKDGTLAASDSNDFDPCVPDKTSEACTGGIERYVTKISGQSLKGEIPATIKDFTYLKILKLDNNNNISGEIPKVLGDLDYLEHLLLANNKFTGEIPVELANISTLKTLSLSSNKLIGSIPAVFGNLLELRYFHVFDNKLSCYMPSEFTKLKNLVDGDGLRIHDNQILVPEEETDLYSFLDKKSPKGEAVFTSQINPYCGEIPTDLILDSQSIDENKPTETLVSNLSTLDEDDTIFTYTLVVGDGSNDNKSFKIIGSTLVSSEIFDYETKNSYYIRLNTNDGDNNFEKEFTISINDVNLAPTDIYLSSNIIPEQQIVTTPIGKFTSEDDGESKSLTYSLVGGVGATDNGSFLINGDELQAGRVFDFATQSVFSIRVNINDGVSDFSKVFIITISSDRDGDGVTDTSDINPSDACLPLATSLACLSQDRDRDNVADGSDLDPNDPCVPHSASQACRNKWGPYWDLLYGDGVEPPDPIPEEPLDSCGQSCRYGIDRYEGGYFTGATGKNGVFRTGDFITYIPPKGHSLETYHVNYSKIGVWKIKKAYESVQIKPGYLDHQKIQFPLHVKNGEGKQIVLLRSPIITIDNNPAIYKDTGHFIGASGSAGAFMEGDELRYFGPVDRKEGDSFEIDLYQVGMSDFLAERYPWILTDIESWYGKYLDVYVTVTDISGNENKFKGPRIWFGKVRKTEDLQAEYLEKKSSANKPVLAEKVEKIPQRKKNPFFRPEDPYDMVLKENLDKQINRPTEPKVIEDFDLRKDLEKNWGIISTPPTVENPFPAEEKAQKSGSPELRQRLLKKQHKSAKKKLSPPSLRDYLDGLMK